MIRLMIALLPVFILTSCSENSNNETTERITYGYDSFFAEDCPKEGTGSHRFTSKEDYCEALFNDSLNNNCARDERLKNAEVQCPDLYAQFKKEEAEKEELAEKKRQENETEKEDSPTTSPVADTPDTDETGSDDSTPSEEPEEDSFFASVLKFVKDLTGIDGAPLFEGESAIEMAKKIVNSGFDFEEFKTAMSFFSSLTDSNGNFLLVGAAAVDKTLQFLSTGGNLEALQASYAFFGQLVNPQTSNLLYFGGTALTVAERFIASGLDLDEFKQAQSFFGSMIDGTDWLFPGTSSVDLTFSALSDENFNLTGFVAKYLIYQSMTANDGVTALFNGQQSAQKAFDVLGVNLSLTELLP